MLFKSEGVTKRDFMSDCVRRNRYYTFPTLHGFYYLSITIHLS